MSLDKANRFLSFPETEVTQYLSDFPDALNKGIMVSGVVSGTPAVKFLRSGDVIWSIDGRRIGPNLYELQYTINNAKSDKITLQIYRSGKLMESDIPVYDLYKNEVRRMVIFEGTVFYEADDFTTLLTGINASEVCVMNVNKNSDFYSIPCMYVNNADDVYYLKITRVGDYEINNLDDLIRAIPQLVKEKQFVVYYQNYLGYAGYNKKIFNDRTERFKGIKYSGINGESLLLEYNGTTKSWDSKKILQPLEDQCETVTVG